MSRTQSFTSADKDKNPSTPRSKIGHRRVDETGETTYKKASMKTSLNITIIITIIIIIIVIEAETCFINTFILNGNIWDDR